MNRDAVRKFAARGAAVVHELWSGDVVIGGVPLEATVSDPETRTALVSGGTNHTGDIVVSVLKTKLPAAPAKQTVVRWDGRNYVVMSVQGEKEISPTWRLVCEPHN